MLQECQTATFIAPCAPCPSPLPLPCPHLRSLTNSCASSDTWPSLLGLVNVGVPEQYLWSLFTLVSAAVQNTWGPYNPTTWGEALVWTIGMVLVAVLFAVIVGFITAAIRSSIQTKAKYKDMMDTVVVRHSPHDTH